MGYECLVYFTYVPSSKNYDESKNLPQGVSEGVKIDAQIRSDYGKIINSKNWGCDIVKFDHHLTCN